MEIQQQNNINLEIAIMLNKVFKLMLNQDNISISKPIPKLNIQIKSSDIIEMPYLDKYVIKNKDGDKEYYIDSKHNVYLNYDDDSYTMVGKFNNNTIKLNI
tara:strand:+ start:635 stop:937 length:303 start_codon:yes stop_codon:yes gene_type:complete